ncbi:MAG: zinc-dependent metalloprotease [Frankiaceae bacterium]
MSQPPFGLPLPGPGGRGDVPAGAPFFAELERLLAWQGGPVNWDLASQWAVRSAGEDDAPVTSADRAAVQEAVRLAELWLDPATELPAGTTGAEAWSRVQWIENTLPVWRNLCDPVAERVVEAMGQGLTSGLSQLKDTPGLSEQLPLGMDLGQLAAAAGPFLGLVRQIGGLLFGAQVGQALGQLAREVVSSTEVGLPLGPAGRAALLPANIAEFGRGLGLPTEEIQLYLALREAAHQRLFAHVPWLRGHLLGAVEEYARGITVDPEAVGRAVSSVDPTRMDPEGLQQALGEGVFEPARTPEQEAALARLETMLALVEGWVDEVADSASGGHLPSAAALRETIRRRRATGGPAEQTFAALVGLELRPRRLREAATLWRRLAQARGVSGRDGVWSHPDLLPGPADLDDAERFVSQETGADPAEAIEAWRAENEFGGPGMPGTRAPDGSSAGGPGEAGEAGGSGGSGGGPGAPGQG